MIDLLLRVSMIALGVSDMTRSVEFYEKTLGLQMIGKPGEVTLFRAGEITLVLNHPLGRSAGPTMAGAVEVIFPVEGVAAAQASLTERGCKFIQTQHEITPGMWAATFTDPDGHKLTVLGPR